jgi:SAM-dependent methyltransferase
VLARTIDTLYETRSVPMTVEDAAAGRRDALVGRLIGAALGAVDLLNVYLGDRLGLYQGLVEVGLATSSELAARTGVHERYAREWLEQQAVTGLVDVDDVGAEAAQRRYALPAGHDEVLTAPDSLHHLAYLSRLVASIGQVTPKLLEAYRTGDGVAWADFGADMREAQAAQNRPIFRALLGTEWLPRIPDVHGRLRADPPGRVADVGCGAGWSSIAIAEAYPTVLVDGFDLDEASIAVARANAADHGVADRVRFDVRDITDPGLTGRYDLVAGFEMLHDLARPVDALAAMRRLLADGGTVLIVDERVAESFTVPGDALERLFYGFSTLCCLPTGMADQPSAATGTVMRPATLRSYAHAAGFGDVTVLPIEHDLFRFYRLRP